MCARVIPASSSAVSLETGSWCWSETRRRPSSPLPLPPERGTGWLQSSVRVGEISPQPQNTVQHECDVCTTVKYPSVLPSSDEKCNGSTLSSSRLIFIRQRKIHDSSSTDQLVALIIDICLKKKKKHNQKM